MNNLTALMSVDPPFGWTAVTLCFLASAAFSYLCGCFNGSVIVSKYILRDDVRNHGSGNAGLTNFFRTFGGPLTLAVIALDVIKGILAVCMTELFTAMFVFDSGWFLLSKYWAALFCLLGHMFPCMFHFRGGKGILTGGTIVWLLDWRVGLVVWAGFLVLAVLTRYISLGSCWAGASFPFATWFVFRSPLCTLLAALTGGLILFQHRGNIVRLCRGTENKFSLHKKDGGK